MPRGSSLNKGCVQMISRFSTSETHFPPQFLISVLRGHWKQIFSGSKDTLYLCVSLRQKCCLSVPENEYFKGHQSMGYIRTAFSELACLKNQESLNFPLLKICVKIISLPKTQSQRVLLLCGVLKKNCSLIICFSKDFLAN